MNKRCLVNVATGEFYCKMQNRLIESFKGKIDFIRNSIDGFDKHDLMRGGIKGIDLMVWHNCLPEGSRSHEESPYGFKVHAIKAAYEMGYTSILWLDSPAYAVKEDISPIFDKIEKEGYYAMSHIDPLERWVGDFALKIHGFNRESLIGENLPSGSCFGFNMDGYYVNIFKYLFDAEQRGEFRNEIVNDSIIHRHDEAVLALILKKHKLPIFTFDPLFQSDSPECVIKSGG